MTPNLLNVTPELSAAVAAKSKAVKTLLTKIAHDYSPVVFANSLGAEDMVLTDLILKNHLKIGIFSLDTGRLPPETYDLMGTVEKHYQTKLTVFFPRADDVELYVHNQGINGFYESVTLRKACCAIRKVEPLKRALAGKRAWITGMRAEQAATRGNLAVQEFDEGNGLEKFNPLADWREKEIWAYIKEHGVPYNALHDKFYPSIGRAPCTRAVSLGEDVRAGRWWWENPESKECGLHVKEK